MMKKLISHLIAILIVCISVFTGCRQTEVLNSNATLSNAEQTTAAGNAKIDDSLKKVAIEFQKKLEYYDGDLLSLKLNDEGIYVEWNSKKCDWVEEEVIDLAISINRGYVDPIKSIRVKRNCGSVTKEFKIDGGKFMRYKSGQLSDSQFTEGIK